ncbi:MAG: ribosome maturation factor RimP [Gammaproteobacteria bacterium]
MYKQNQLLVELLQPVIAAMGYEMLGVEQIRKGRGSLVRVYIDSESGITLADCERVSEQVSGVLDVNDPIPAAYELEISSPGLDRILFTLAHFERFIGHRVRIGLCRKVDGRKNIAGKINAVNDDTVTIVENGDKHEIAADMIEKARLAH